MSLSQIIEETLKDSTAIQIIEFSKNFAMTMLGAHLGVVSPIRIYLNWREFGRIREDLPCCEKAMEISRIPAEAYTFVCSAWAVTAYNLIPMMISYMH